MKIVSLGDRDALRATVTAAVWRGATTRLVLSVGGLPDQLIDIDVPGNAQIDIGTEVGVRLPEPAGVLVRAREHDRAARTAPGRPTRRRRRRAEALAARWLWALPPLAVVLIAALYPLIRVCLESLKVGETQRGFGTWSDVLGSEMFRDALWRTVAIAATSTVGCLVLGTFLAIVLAFVPFPGSRLVGRLIDTVLALPSFLITLAFTFLYGTAGAVNAAIAGLTGGTSPALNFLYTPAGVIAAEITFFTPFVVRPLLASFAVLPRAQLDVAASLGASPLRVLAIRGAARSVARADGGRQPGAAVDAQRVRHRAVHRRQGRHHAAGADLHARHRDLRPARRGRDRHRADRAVALPCTSLYRLIFARLMSGRGKGDADVVVEQAK